MTKKSSLILVCFLKRALYPVDGVNDPVARPNVGLHHLGLDPTTVNLVEDTVGDGGQIQQEPEGCPLLATAKSETMSLAGRQLGGCTSEQFWGFRLKLLGWGFQLLSNSSANV